MKVVHRRISNPRIDRTSTRVTSRLEDLMVAAMAHDEVHVGSMKDELEVLKIRMVSQWCGERNWSCSKNMRL